jgi:signal transduction histidine kinase
MRATPRPFPESVWVLPIGLGAVLLLIAFVAAFAAITNADIETENAVRDRGAEHSSYLVGHLDALLAQQWAEALDTTTETGAELEPIVKSIRELDVELDRSVAALPDGLTPLAAARWRATAPAVTALRQTLDHALAVRLAGDPAAAETILDDVEQSYAEVSSELDLLVDVAHAENAGRIAAAERAAATERNVEIGAFAALFIATLAIAGAMLRVIVRQRRTLAAHLDAMEHANKDLEAFAGRVAHDLKNMLAPIVLAVPILRRARKENGAPAPEVIENVALRIERASRRAVDLLEGLLAFARAGAPASGDARASPAVELEGVLEDLAPAIERSDAHIESDVDPSLEVACAPALLHVVLLNLVGNAVKFIGEREQRRVKVIARRDANKNGERCVIRVEDTGPGIAAAVVSRIFDPFYRAPGAKAGGAGIGLATVRRVVDAYGGDVAVESEEGHGATFIVSLPLAPGSANAKTGDSSAPSPASRAASPWKPINT